MSESASRPTDSSDGASWETAPTTSGYQLTVKRGFLALLVMYACQILVGTAVSKGFAYLQGSSEDAASVDIQVIGLISVLVGGAFVLLWLWTDLRRFGKSFLPQIGLQKSAVHIGRAVLLVLVVLAASHFLAWIYRSVLLPSWGHGGVIGGGSQMFAYISDTGSLLGMTGFLVLALIIGPVMEEFVFRGYLQSSLATRLPTWAAIVITSVLFMAGHGPTILWPMYFVFSVAWGWVFVYTKSLKLSILIHVLSNLFYTVVAFMGWNLLA